MDYAPIAASRLPISFYSHMLACQLNVLPTSRQRSTYRMTRQVFFGEKPCETSKHAIDLPRPMIACNLHLPVHCDAVTTSTERSIIQTIRPSEASNGNGSGHSVKGCAALQRRKPARTACRSKRNGEVKRGLEAEHSHRTLGGIIVVKRPFHQKYQPRIFLAKGKTNVHRLGYSLQ